MMVKLTMDNGACNDHVKLSVNISEEALEDELKRYFKWRNHSGYSSYLERYRSLGSSKYDEFILYLSNLGYGK